MSSFVTMLLMRRKRGTTMIQIEEMMKKIIMEVTCPRKNCEGVRIYINIDITFVTAIISSRNI